MKTLVLIFLVLAGPFSSVIAQPFTVRLWPDGIPGSKANPGYTEKITTLEGRVTRCEKVTDPDLTVFLPPTEKANGMAVLICPGGGYGMLAFDHEGNAIAGWLNDNGIAGIILKYRLPSDLIMENKSTGPLQDAQEAMRIIRRNAARWNIDPGKVGVIGFSAGGHLASTLSTHYAEKVYESKDNTSARPDFSILIYPVITFDAAVTHMGSRNNLIGPDPDETLVRHFSNDKQITPDTPPTFLVHSTDDRTVPVMNSILYYTELQKNKVTSEMHIFQRGGHGFGLAPKGGTESAWPGLCIRWLGQIQAAGNMNRTGGIGQAATGEWVRFDENGKLSYRKTDKGDRIMDFSHAGYMGGGVAIPGIPVKIILFPTGGDDTGNIQEAIDRVSALPLSGKFRGAVLLSPGTFTISETIRISGNGVVLRGSGSSYGKGERTILKMTGKPFNAVTIRAGIDSGNNPENGSGSKPLQTYITDTYVPSGSQEFNVEDAGFLRAGDIISVRKPVTGKWVEFMQMNDLVRDGKPQTWLKEGTFLVAERKIKSISGKRITVEVPLSDSYDMAYLDPPGVVVEKILTDNRLTQSGVEDLDIGSPSQAVSHTEPHFTALRINGDDCWARNIYIRETMNSVAAGGNRITLTRITVERKALHQGSSRPAEFAPNGTQVLVDRCRVIADNVWFVATGSGVSGPVVLLNCTFTGDQRAESHQRWSTGMLYDNVLAENGGIDFRNRGSMGSGHGWSMGWGVAWNCIAKDFVIQNPPGACNWMIGCIGESRLMPRPFDKEPNLPEGIKDSPGVRVTPNSLYLSQLEERLGREALRNIGY